VRLTLRPLIALRRQAAQNFVEFGLIVAAVAIVGMLGLQVLGGAEEGYFIPLASGLAPRAPVGSDDVVHPTTVQIACTPTTVIVGNQATCTFSVSDAWSVKRAWPRGQVDLYVNDAPTGTSCSLVQDTSTGDAALGKCAVTWSPAVANVPSAKLAAHYVANDGAHTAPTTDPFQMETVQQQVVIRFAPSVQPTACWNPVALVNGDPEAVEIGHPMYCHLKVTDPQGSPVAGTPIQVSSGLGLSDGGTPFFSCWTNGDQSVYSGCPVSQTFVRNTDTNGELAFVYRRYYGALASTVTETFTASSTAYPASPPASHAVRVAPLIPGDDHHTDMVVHCYSNLSGSPASWVSGLGLTVQSDTGLQGSGVQIVVCSVVVFDVDPTNVYRSGNLDAEDAFSPAGWVYWVDDQGHPVMNAATQPASCPLQWGNSVGDPYLRLQVNGLPDYASTCTVALKLSGAENIQANYNGNPGVHLPTSSKPINIDFH
jgi:hypothetical protein